jgi:hypothetical protein
MRELATRNVGQWLYDRHGRIVVKSFTAFISVSALIAAILAVLFWRSHHNAQLGSTKAVQTIAAPLPALAAALPPPPTPPLAPTQTVALTPESIATLSDGPAGEGHRLFATDPALKKLDEDMYHCTRMMHMQGITAQQLVDKLAELGQRPANVQEVQDTMDQCAPFVAGAWIKQWFDVAFRAERGDQLAGDYLLEGMRGGFALNLRDKLPDQAKLRIAQATEVAMRSAIERGDAYWIRRAPQDYSYPPDETLPQNIEKSYRAFRVCVEVDLCDVGMRQVYVKNLAPDVIARLEAQAKVEADRIRPNVRPGFYRMRP